MANWYCPIKSLTKIIVWKEGKVKTYHSALRLDKKGIRAGEDHLIKKCFLESAENWQNAVVYDNQTKEQRSKWVNRIKVE